MRIKNNIFASGAILCVAFFIGIISIATIPSIASASEAMNHYNKANNYIRRGEIDKAIVELKKAIEIDPDYADAHYNLGFLYHYKAAQKNNTKPGLTFTDVAGQTYIKKWKFGHEELDLAIKELKEVVRLQPNAADAHFKLGLVYDNKGDYEKAIFEYQKAISFDPTGLDGQDARTNISLIYYFVQERRNDAIKELKEVLKINPNHRIAKKTLKLFQK